jgi:hypothetical protein
MIHHQPTMARDITMTTNPTIIQPNNIHLLLQINITTSILHLHHRSRTISSIKPI